jgi:hypothetical protein
MKLTQLQQQMQRCPKQQQLFRTSQKPMEPQLARA